MAKNAKYEDEKPNNFPNDFNKKDIDSRVALRTESVRNKMYGDDVREGISQAAEISSAVATESNKNSSSAKKTAEDTQKRFDNEIHGQDKDDEAKDARVSKADGKTYNILKDRLDAMDKKPQQAVDDLQIGGRNLLKNSDFLIDSGAKALSENDVSVITSQLAGREVSLSVGINVDNVASVSGRARIYVNLTCYHGTDKLAIGTALKTFKVGDSFHGRIVNTFIIPDGTDRFGSCNITIEGVAGVNLEVGRPKLEPGTKATEWTPAPEDNHRHQAFRKGTRFFAHRGSQKQAPENTLLAIRKTSAHAGVEIDIHATADGRWVVIHDESVERTTNGQGKVSSFTFNDLRKLRIDAGYYYDKYPDKDLIIPSLEEALTVCKDKQLIPIIEIKKDSGDRYTSDNFDDLVNIIHQFGISDEMMFISFDYDSLKEVKKRLPLVEVSYLTRDITTDLLSKAASLGVNSGIDVQYTAAGVTTANIIKAHNQGLKVGVWTTPDDETRNSLISKGVDFITTNSMSGELRQEYLSLENGWKNNSSADFASYVREVSPGEIEVSFNIREGNRKQGTLIASLPDWADLQYQSWNPCAIRTISNGGAFGTFDIIPYNKGVSPQIRVGLNWDDESDYSNRWVSGSATYHV